MRGLLKNPFHKARSPFISATHSASSGSPAAWRGKAFFRLVLLLVTAALVAAVAANFGIARDYGYLRASVLTGATGGYYYTLATRLAERAKLGHGSLSVISTAGSVENISRLISGQVHCTENFALIQDGTPVSADAKLELLGRLPEPESLLLLGRPDNAFHTFADFRGASIGVGPQGSGTAYLMHQLFQDTDLRQLDVRVSYHELSEQAQLVSQGKLDLAAVVMQEDAEFLRNVIRQYGLDIVAPTDFQGLIARYPWLSLGRIPAGRYDLVRPIPAADKQVARLNTLVVASSCARRADRIALLMLLGAELPGFIRANPPGSTSSATVMPLASESHQFFLSGEPAPADRYFPWLVNVLSPAYWVYLIMAVTILFNAMMLFSRFCLWRIDAAREKLDIALKQLVNPELTHAQMRAVPPDHVVAAPERRVLAQSILDQLVALRGRCQRQASSIVTPLGDEMYYRYQQFLIDEATNTLAALLQGSANDKGARWRPVAHSE
jgi:TRAP transporter TAXI family solute receptor